MADDGVTESGKLCIRTDSSASLTDSSLFRIQSPWRFRKRREQRSAVESKIRRVLLLSFQKRDFLVQ